MNKKIKNREAAQKRAKKKRRTTLGICAILIVAVIAAIVVYEVTRPETRVFAVTNQSVILHENGNFTARLAHNINISGTFTEEVGEDITTISFISGDNIVSSQIIDDVLVLPVEWRANCRIHRHETEFPLRR